MVVIDGNLKAGTAVGTVKPATPAPVATSPVPASQPKSQLYQAVNGSVWKWNPFVNQWQMVQSKPSVATPYAPQLVGTITKPIAGQPGAFVTVKNVANPTAPGEVFLPNVSAPIIIPAGPPTSSAQVTTFPVQPPSHNASYNAPSPSAPAANPIFAKPAPLVSTASTQASGATAVPTAPAAPTNTFDWFPWLVLIALAYLFLRSTKDENT